MNMSRRANRFPFVARMNPRMDCDHFGLPNPQDRFNTVSGYRLSPPFRTFHWRIGFALFGSDETCYTFPTRVSGLPRPSFSTVWMDPRIMSLPIQHLYRSLRSTGVARFFEHFESLFPDTHMKDLVVDVGGPGREVEIHGRRVVNFGSDSFLGLDLDPRVKEAVIRGVEKWGTHNGTSRAFASVRANIVAEEKIAEWLGTEAALIFPSVTLANAGAIPGLVTKTDVIIADEYAHNSIHEGNKIARSNGTRVYTFRHNDVNALADTLRNARPYRHALITIDGVYSMSGALPPLKEMNALALENDAVLYVDDAHGTGVMGAHGRGTVYDNL